MTYPTDLEVAWQETPIDSAKYNDHINATVAAMAFKVHEQASPGLTLLVEPAKNVDVGGKAFAYVGGSSAAFTPPGAGSETHLYYAYNNAGALAFAIFTGVFTPGDPDTYPAAADYPLCEVVLAAGTTQIVDALLTDVRPFGISGTVTATESVLGSVKINATEADPIVMLASQAYIKSQIYS